MGHKGKIWKSLAGILAAVCVVTGVAGCGSEKEADDNRKTQEKEIRITDELQRDMNYFLSKFPEFRMYEYNESTEDYERLRFAHTFIEYNYFNRVEYIEEEENFYTSISLEDINTALQYFFGEEVHPQKNKKIPPKDAEEDIYCMYKEGNILFPSAAGEESAVAAIVNRIVETKENNYEVEFGIYGVDNVDDIDYYNWDQVYDFDEAEIEKNTTFSKRSKGKAVVEKVKDDKGEHYRLIEFKVE